MPAADEQFHSGFCCFVGRPNAGKSTLTNAITGSKVAITSSKPQTTRHAIRGIVHREHAQLVLIDTPGLHRPRTLLGERLNDVVRGTWTEVDVVAVCFPADQRIGPGDEYLVAELAALAKVPTLIALATKIDLISKSRLAQQLLAIQHLQEKLGVQWEEIIPVSVVADEQVDVVSESIIALLPPGPAYYADGEITDSPTEKLVSELIRESALEGVREELPHSITVTIEEMEQRAGRSDDKPLLDIFANLIVERESQKPIVIGRKGARLKEVGTAARGKIEALLGTSVHLDLRVKVLKEWQRDAKHLNRLGF